MLGSPTGLPPRGTGRVAGPVAPPPGNGEGAMLAAPKLARAALLLLVEFEVLAEVAALEVVDEVTVVAELVETDEVTVMRAREARRSREVHLLTLAENAFGPQAPLPWKRGRC